VASIGLFPDVRLLQAPLRHADCVEECPPSVVERDLDSGKLLIRIKWLARRINILDQKLADRKTDKTDRSESGFWEE
jgi:hypothetical protein